MNGARTIRDAATAEAVTALVALALIAATPLTGLGIAAAQGNLAGTAALDGDQHGRPAAGVVSAEPLVARDVEADRLHLDVTLHENGSATWRTEYRIRLATENDTAAFESLRADIEANRSEYRGEFAAGMRAAVAEAANATGREMTATDFAVRAERRQLPSEYGVVTYTFHWSNFTAAEGGDLRAGDALGGMFLDETTTLQLRWPEGYAVESVAPEPDERTEESVSWHGPTDFGPDRPTLVVAPTGPIDGLPGPAVLVGTVLALAIGALVVRSYRGTGATPVAGVGAGGAAGTDDSDPDGDTDDGGAAAAEGSTGPPPELLSNEERVLALLHERGGRIKQQVVVSELDWTAAKTSQVVGDMREAGDVEVFRLGRENVIRLPDEGIEPSDEGSASTDGEEDAS